MVVHENPGMHPPANTLAGPLQQAQPAQAVLIVLKPPSPRAITW